jgi:hypothetical protein
MSSFTQFSAMAYSAKIDAENGIIYSVVVMSKGEAKGHNLMLDDKSIDGFLALCQASSDGVKIRFGKDHDAGADDINGALKNFRREGDKIFADMHLLKSDANYAKLIEMAQKMPNQFGLSASTTATEELIGHEKFVRFSEVQSVDIVSNPAATKGLFFSANNHTQKNMTKIALALGLPETATEAEIEAAAKLALEAKKKMESKCHDTEGKKHEQDADANADADAEADDEEKRKQGKKKFSAELEAVKLELAAIKNAENERKAAAHKAELESIKLEAGKDGKVIPLSDEAFLKLSVADAKDMVSKLAKNQVKLAKGNNLPTNKEGKALDKNSPEFKAYLSQKREENALALGQKMSQK